MSIQLYVNKVSKVIVSQSEYRPNPDSPSIQELLELIRDDIENKKDNTEERIEFLKEINGSIILTIVSCYSDTDKMMSKMLRRYHRRLRRLHRKKIYSQQEMIDCLTRDFIEIELEE